MILILEEMQCLQYVVFAGNALAFGAFSDELPRFVDDDSRITKKTILSRFYSAHDFLLVIMTLLMIIVSMPRKLASGNGVMLDFLSSD